jgi:hypothetical protein
LSRQIMPWLDGVRHSESSMGNIWRWGWMCKIPGQHGICMSADGIRPK